MAVDFETQGVVYDLTADWKGKPNLDALSLRLIGACHAAALSGRDLALRAVYPEANPDWTLDKVWPQVEAFLKRDTDWVRGFMRSPPQTNEMRRSLILMAGFLYLAKRFEAPMHLLEIGASAGLNTIWDKYQYSTAVWQRLPADQEGSPVVTTDWSGVAPPVEANFEIASRAACDQNPLDLKDADAAMRLRSYIWPDQKERLSRFDAARKLAVAHDVKVEKADAAEWLEDKLAKRPATGLTIVYHSVFFQYPPSQTREKLRYLIRNAIKTAPPDAPVAWLRFEPEGLFGPVNNKADMTLETEFSPDGERVILARSDGHVTRVAALAALAE